MEALNKYIENILDTGFKILFELEKEEPNIEKVNELYAQRGEQINELDEIPEAELKNINDECKMKTKNCLMRLQLLEKYINRTLTKLSESRRESIEKIKAHQIAKMSYSFSNLNKNGEQSTFIDLKSTG